LILAVFEFHGKLEIAGETLFDFRVLQAFHSFPLPLQFNFESEHVLVARALLITVDIVEVEVVAVFLEGAIGILVQALVVHSYDSL